jgi:serine/threonine-protein kinase
MSSEPMLRLHTLGGLTLSRGSENLTGALTQRRRLAILALLAVAGESGMSRDKLLAYLWPESDAERARHVLNQLLYAQRRQAGSPSLFAGQKTLRLDPAVIRTDVAEFGRALAAGDLAAAAELYHGPFLDGFHLKDAPEFDRWADEQRARLARQVLAACTTLADNAAASGDARRAAEWWRRASALDPYDGSTAVGLIRTLADSGDRAGALVAARRHEELLRRDLGLAPDRVFTETVARLGGS